jgi:hypothetical protein
MKQTDGRRSYKWAERKKCRHAKVNIIIVFKSFPITTMPPQRIDALIYIYPVITDMSFMQK